MVFIGRDLARMSNVRSAFGNGGDIHHGPDEEDSLHIGPRREDYGLHNVADDRDGLVSFSEFDKNVIEMLMERVEEKNMTLLEVVQLIDQKAQEDNKEELLHYLVTGLEELVGGLMQDVSGRAFMEVVAQADSVSPATLQYLASIAMPHTLEEANALIGYFERTPMQELPKSAAGPIESAIEFAIKQNDARLLERCLNLAGKELLIQTLGWEAITIPDLAEHSRVDGIEDILQVQDIKRQGLEVTILEAAESNKVMDWSIRSLLADLGFSEQDGNWISVNTAFE